MQPHQERVVTEKAELDEKISKLSAFIWGNDVFKDLFIEEQMRLRRQVTLMELYSETLGARINAFQTN